MGIPTGSIPLTLQQADCVPIPSRPLSASHTRPDHASSHCRDSPQCKDIRVLGEGQLVLLGVRRELTDDLGSEVAQPPILDAQLVLPPAKHGAEAAGTTRGEHHHQPAAPQPSHPLPVGI